MSQLSRIRISIGNCEVECEGSEQFVHSEVDVLLQRLLAQNESLLSMSKSSGSNYNTVAENDEPIQLTISSIAAKLQPKTGADLVVAACAKLTLVENNVTFSRSHIVSTMREAAGYFKESYVSNLTRTLQALLKEDKLREQSKDRYALEAKTLNELRNSLK